MTTPRHNTAPEESPGAASESLGGDAAHDSTEGAASDIIGMLGDLFPQIPDGSTAGRKTFSDRSTAGRKTSSKPRGYIDNYRPQAKTRDLLNDVDAVLEEYREHWPLTVRQVFYRLVGAHGYNKSESAYGRLCHHLANARRGRWLPFDAIRDDGVSVIEADHYRDQDDFLAQMHERARFYTVDKLARQDLHIEVWCEAAGMVYQLANVARRYSINVYSSSGFDSLTAKKNMAERIIDIGKRAVILHLGDFDPSGESIFRSVAEDVSAFVEADRTVATDTVEFRRVALTAEQVAVYGLPTAPAKATDQRSKTWEGETCQLEALAPSTIANVLQVAIDDLIDTDVMADDIARQAEDRRYLTHALPMEAT